jgi:small subunit ribosomal protein S16
MPIAQEKDQVSIDMERAKYWISVGAQPTDIVKKLMNRQAAKKAE